MRNIDLIDKAIYEAKVLESKTGGCKISITLNSGQCLQIIEDFTGVDFKKTGVSDFKIYGFSVYPSDFLEHNSFLVGIESLVFGYNPI